MSDDRRPWLLLDFDGVLNLGAPRKGDDAEMLRALGWRHGVARLDAGTEEVCCNARHGGWLTRLARETGSRLAWATMRQLVASERCAPLCGLPAMPVVPVLGTTCKAESVVPWTAGVPFAWFDDLACECEEADYLAGSQPHLMIEVDPRHGLGEEHIMLARQWLAARAGLLMREMLWRHRAGSPSATRLAAASGGSRG